MAVWNIPFISVMPPQTMAESEKLNSLIGIEFDRRIDMIATPSFYNFNIVADVHPFDNRKWRISAGLYWSFSKTIGHAENATYDAPALVSASIYFFIV